MVELAAGASMDQGPGASRRLSEARAALAAPAAAEALRSAIPLQEEVGRTLRTLLEKMEEWEDFQTILRDVQDEIEQQRSLRARTIRELQATKKK
jgi:hypothetical protein